MQNAMERVCTLKRQKIVRAYKEVQDVLAGGCKGVVGFVAQQ
jgi:5-methylcytosine-specific restriction endonuclease McrBC regulatory subunit McrC